MNLVSGFLRFRDGGSNPATRLSQALSSSTKQTKTMKKFSLLSVFLGIMIVALCCSQLIMMRKLEKTNAEIDDVRVKFGYIQVDDPSLTYVSRVPA